MVLERLGMAFVAFTYTLILLRFLSVLWWWKIVRHTDLKIEEKKYYHQLIIVYSHLSLDSTLHFKPYSMPLPWRFPIQPSDVMPMSKCCRECLLSYKLLKCAPAFRKRMGLCGKFNTNLGLWATSNGCLSNDQSGYPNRRWSPCLSIVRTIRRLVTSHHSQQL